MAASRAYWANSAFERHSGRLCVACAVDDDAGDSLAGVVAAVSRVARERGPEVALKVVSADKHGPVEFGRFDDPDDVGAIRSWLFDTYEYSLIHTAGRRPAFLVQERVRLEAEYRVVVVDGEPIAGAGCIESMCPPYNKGEDVWRGARFPASAGFTHSSVAHPSPVTGQGRATLL